MINDVNSCLASLHNDTNKFLFVFMQIAHSLRNNGKSNLPKGDIPRWGCCILCKRIFDNIFQYICQVAARVAQLVLAGAFGTLIFVTWKVVGDSSNIRNSDGGFLQGLHCDQCAICNHSTSICHRMSLALKSTRVSHFEAKRGKQGLLTDVSQILL